LLWPLRLSICHWITVVSRNPGCHEGHLVRVGIRKERYPPVITSVIRNADGSDAVYVFHAPDISITTSRLSAAVASVRYCLSRSSINFLLKKLPSHPRTIPPCLCGGLRKALHPNSRNHQLVCPPGIQLGSLSPRSLRLQVRVGRAGRYPPTYYVVIAGSHSSIAMLEVNSGLGSNGRSPQVALYA